MSRLLSLLAILALVISARACFAVRFVPLEASYKLCKTEEDISAVSITDATIFPSPPVRGKPLDLRIAGVSTLAISAGSLRIEVTKFGLPLYSEEVDLVRRPTDSAGRKRATDLRRAGSSTPAWPAMHVPRCRPQHRCMATLTPLTRARPLSFHQGLAMSYSTTKSRCPSSRLLAR
jgi:hypothetical protein